MKLAIVPAALSELQDAAAFYTATADVELGLAFVSEFERAARSLLENPRAGVVFRGTRSRFLLRRFPYSIIYHLRLEELRIIAVAHQRCRPGYWAGRSLGRHRFPWNSRDICSLEGGVSLVERIQLRSFGASGSAVRCGG